MACRLSWACGLIKDMITGAAQMDGAILWYRRQTTDAADAGHILLARAGRGP